MGILRNLLDRHVERKCAKSQVLLHGTNEAYLKERIKFTGSYNHSPRDVQGSPVPVYLTPFPESAIDYALRRSTGRSEQPVVLIVEIQIIRHKLQRVLLHPVIDALDTSEFKIHIVGDGKVEEEIENLRLKIQGLSHS